ncbi:hypothetical protein OUZ56_018985 [Daphnia magna]|uniref:Uncharacterized protein n=1 Tax=Daphnia magna TaxID=35525 RepID=A0ABQ9ZAD5_9CRUS|nr:hypothetical protein OUZ56_018985 [Daphnia magna]
MLLNAFDSQSRFQFYASDTSGHFHPVFAASEDNFDGQPIATLSRLDGSITSTMAHVEELKNNVVHFKDNVTANGTVVIAQMNFSQSPVIDTIKVLYNFSEGFVRPKEIESKKSLPKNTKSFVLHKLHHFYGEQLFIQLVEETI